MAEGDTFKIIYRPGTRKGDAWIPGRWSDYVDTSNTAEAAGYQRRAVVTFLSTVFR